MHHLSWYFLELDIILASKCMGVYKSLFLARKTFTFKYDWVYAE